VRKGDDLTTFIVPKVMKNPEALTFRIPKGLIRPVAGNLYLYLYLSFYVGIFGLELLITLSETYSYIHTYIRFPCPEPM
jgi:hypothetical protein